MCVIVKTKLLKKYILLLILFLGFLFSSHGCSDNYDVVGVNSPNPGILRIYIKSDEADNFIVIAGDTVKTGEGENDSLALIVGQGRAYRGKDYVVLYNNLDEYLERKNTINIIKQENKQYKEYLIFETFLPPAVYDSIKISIESNYIQIGFYKIPIEMSSQFNPIIKFDNKFKIKENKITEYRLQLCPFKSLIRVGDFYQFYPNIKVINIVTN